MKKNTKFEGIVENGRGRKLDTPLKYEAEYDAFETRAEVIAANEDLTDEDVVNKANDKRKAAARGKAINAALDAAGIPKQTLEDEQFRLRKMYDVLVANGKSHDEARAIAATVLGLTWDK
jgi:hypothetical protein